MCKLGDSIIKSFNQLPTYELDRFCYPILLNRHSKIFNLEKYLLGGWKGQVHDLSHFTTPSSLLGVLYQFYCEASFLKCVMLICVKNCKKSPAKLFMVKMKPFNLNKDHLRLIHYAVMAIRCSSKHLVL